MARVRWLLVGAAVRVARIAGGLVLLVLVAVAIALGLAHTGWGRAKIAAFAEAKLDPVFTGNLSIGGLEGSVLSHFVLTDVMLHDAAGRLVIGLDRVVVDYDPLVLLSRTFHADEIAVAGVVVHARERADGTINLGDLLAPREKPEGAGPSWRVIVEDLSLAGGDVSYQQRGGAVVEVSDIAIEGAVTVRPGEVTRAFVDHATARCQGRLLALSGEVIAGGRRVDVSLDGQVAGARAEVTARLFPASSSLTGSIAVTDFNPHAFYATAPRGRLDVDIELSARGALLSEASAEVTFRGRGALAEATIHDAQGTARLENGTVFGDVAIETSAGKVSAAGILNLAAQPVMVRSAHAVIDVGELSALAGDALAVNGSLEGELWAEGPANDLTARGSLAGTALRYEDLSVRSAIVRGEVAGLPGSPVGRLSVVVKRIKRREKRLGDLSARARFRDHGRHIEASFSADGGALPVGGKGRVIIDREAGGQTRVDVPQMTIETGAATWQGRARGVVEEGGDIDVQALRLSSPAGRIAASGRITKGGRIHTLDLRASDVEVAEIATALGVRRPHSGTLEATVHLEDGMRAAEVDIAVEALRLEPGDRAMRLSVDVGVENRRATAVVAANAQPLGTGGLHFIAKIPARPWRAEAWRALDVRALEWAHGSFVVDLNALSRAFESLPVMEGNLRAKVEASAGLNTAHLEVHAGGVEHAQLPFSRPVAAAIEADISPEASVASVDLGIGGSELIGVSLLRAKMAVNAGLRELLAGNARAFLNAETQGSLDIDVPLAFVQRALGKDYPLGGRLAATATLAGTTADPRIRGEAALVGMTINDVPVVAMTARGQFSGRSWDAEIAARQPDGGKLAIRGEGRGAALKTVAFSAQAFQLGFLSPLLQKLEAPVVGVDGVLSADLAVASPLGQAAIFGWLRVRGGELKMLGFRPLGEVSLEARARGGEVALDVRGESGNGTVELSGTTWLNGLMPVRFEAELASTDMPVIVGGSTAVSASLTARAFGETRDDLWRVQLRADEARFRLPKQPRRQDLHPVGGLDDIQYIDVPDAVHDHRDHAHGIAGEMSPVLRLRLEAPRIVVVGENVDALLAADLDITLLGDATAITGTLDVERGHLRLFDRRYVIARGRAAFGGRIPTNPNIDVRLVHRFETATLFIDVGGTLERPRIAFSSDPAIYGQAQLLGFVLGGSPDTGAQITEDKTLEQEAAGIASSLVASQVGAALKQAFPIHVLRFGSDDPVDGSFGFVTVGRWIGEDLFIAYQRRFEPEEYENTNEAQIRYRFSDRWLMEAVAGDAGAGSVDLLWVKRY